MRRVTAGREIVSEVRLCIEHSGGFRDQKRGFLFSDRPRYVDTDLKKKTHTQEEEERNNCFTSVTVNLHPNLAFEFSHLGDLHS